MNDHAIGDTMSKKANPTTIGLFFTLGLALGVAGLVIFSSRSLFHPQQKEILYFDASLKGLEPGAPVKFRGVTIGSVTEVLIRHNQSSNDFSMPVVITLDKKVAQAKADELLEIGNQARLEHLIQQGLRGRLDAESLVTGVLYVALDIVPNAPPPLFHQLAPEYREIPTLPSEIRQLLANVAHLDLRGLSAAYARFVPINHEFKAVCGDWQLRDGRLNDHLDRAYDAAIVDRLGALHAEARPVLCHFGDVVDRLRPYAPRLDECATRVAAGDTKMIAGVMCGSYHDVWMELHEDLLLTQGISRAAEGSY